MARLEGWAVALASHRLARRRTPERCAWGQGIPPHRLV